MSTNTTTQSSAAIQERIKQARQSVADATRDLCSLHCAPTTTTTTVTSDESSTSIDLGLSLFGGGGGGGGGPDSLEMKLVEIEEELRHLATPLVEEENVSALDNINDEFAEEQEVEKLHHQLHFLRRCQDALDHLSSSNDNNLVTSAQAVRLARTAVVQLDSGTNPKLLKSIQNQIRSKHVEIVTAARATLDKSIVFDRDCITVVSGGKVGEAYDALRGLGDGGVNDDLENVLYELANNVYTAVCQPVLLNGQKRLLEGGEKEFLRVVTREQRPGQHILQWTTTTEEEGGLDTIEEEDENNPWCTTLQSMGMILHFLHDVVLPTTLLRRTFGHYLLGSIPHEGDDVAGWKRYYHQEGCGSGGSKSATEGGTLLNDLLQFLWKCIPSTVVELRAVSPALRRSTCKFEMDVISMSFLNDDEQVKVLSDVTTNIAIKYGEKRRRTILARGRAILMEDYYNTVVVGQQVISPADNTSGSVPRVYNDINASPTMSIFKLPRMAISVVSSKVLDLCRETLDEATATTSTTGDGGELDVERAVQPTLYRTSRELLDLYRAIVPSIHGHDVSSIPRCAAVFHNDCVYLAHHLSTLGFLYRDKFSGEEQLLRTMCTFVDMVPTFRELADGCLGEMVERHKLEVVGLMHNHGGSDGGEGVDVMTGLSYSFRMNEGDVSWSDAETALRGAEYHLKQLSNAWRSILSRDVYCRAMGNLVDTVFALLLDPVMKADDVSESASHFITSLFNSVLQSSSELFILDGVASPSSGPSSVDGGGGVSVSASAASLVARSSCDLWDRFTAVCRFMDMSLSDVSDALAGGLFRSVTGPELTRLIRATFDDSEKMQKILLALSE